jgi:arginyl-tRNA--protein-N-Asp/Glu arginylyltransferase
MGGQSTDIIAYHFAIAPEKVASVDLDTALSRGWFRMRQIIFTTTHLNPEECLRVHWLRYVLSKIRGHHSHRQIRKVNGRFAVEIKPLVVISVEHEELYSKYHAAINFGADSIHQALIGEDEDRRVFTTHCISIREGDKLIAAGYFDTGKHSAASILHFYDPEYKRCSLGKYLILVTADFLKANRFKLYYPGYVIAGKSKMNYKLFVGAEATQYFDPGTRSWKDFDDKILLPENLTEEERDKVIIALS